MEQNYYEILEVNKNASPEIIEKAYKTLVKKYHPDLQQDENKNKYEEKIKKINEAYDILSDPEKRKKYDLNLYDKMIKDSNRLFTKVDTNDMDIYQYVSSKYLDYLYIRNNIYIEKLSKEELLYLSSTKELLDSNNEQFIEKTYKKVIFENEYTMYGPDNSKYLKKPNTLIIGLRCKSIDLNNDSDDELDNFLSQQQYLKLFIPELSRQLNDRNLDSIEVIEYNNSSVVKKQEQKYTMKK